MLNSLGHAVNFDELQNSRFPGLLRVGALYTARSLEHIAGPRVKGPVLNFTRKTYVI